MLNPSKETKPEAQTAEKPSQTKLAALLGKQTPQSGASGQMQASAQQDQSSQDDAQNQQQGTSEPQQGQSPSANGQYDPQVQQALEQHLNSLPDVQKAFINHYLTPETVTLMGIVGGVEVYDYFKKYTDPSKMAVIVPRNSQQGGGQALQEDQNAEEPTPPNGNTGNAAQGTAPAQVAEPTQSQETPSQ